MIEFILLGISFLFPFFLGKLYFFPQYILFCILLLLAIVGFKKTKFFYLLPFALFFLLTLCSLTYTFSLFSTRNEILRFGNYFIIFYLYLVYFSTPSLKKSLTNTLLLSSFFVCIYALGIYFLVGEKNLLLFSVFFNPNCFASYLILVLPLAIYKLLTSRSFVSINRYFCLILILFLCLLHTGSRGALLSLFLGGCVWIIVAGKIFVKNRPLKFVLVFCVLISFALFLTRPILQERLYNFFNTSHRSHLYRMLVYKGTMRIIREHPLLGTGPGTFESVYPNYKLGSVNTKLTHNTYLQVASEEGLIGLFLFLFLFVFILANLLSCIKNASKQDEKIFLSCILFSSINFSVHNIFDYPYYIPSISGIYFMLVATGINYKMKTDEIHYGRKAKLTLLFFALPIFIFCTRFGFADLFFEKGDEIEEENLKLAERYFGKATTLDPMSAPYWNALGEIYLKQKKYRDAKLVFQKAVRLEKHSAFYHTGLGMSYIGLGKTEKAISEFKKAHRLHPTFTTPLRELGNIYLKQGKLVDAKKQFQKIVAISEIEYFKDKYLPIPEQKQNPDISYAKLMLDLLK